MAACSFCTATIFSKSSYHDVHGPHHTEFEAWKTSVAGGCTICTLLFQHLISALRDATVDPRPKVWTPPNKKNNRARDDAVRNESLEMLVLREWNDLNGDDDSLSGALLPVYGCSVLDAGGRRSWILRFQPRPRSVPALEYQRVLDVEVKSQNFYVYDAEYDATLKHVQDQSKSIQRLAPRTDSKGTFDQVRRWAEECERTHKLCRPLFEAPSEDAYVPKRLLDVGTQEVPVLRLVETGHKRAADFLPYVTLSYKWGYDADYVLEKSTRERYIKEGLPEAQLPVTFREAVQATRRMNKRYLWIDALCMLQKDADEWLEECPKMQQVYGNSFLSLAAVSADNYVQGLFRTRQTGGLQPARGVVHWDFQNTTCQIVREDFWRGELLSQPLFTRGWVLQERLLAPRILHFQQRQVFWQCPTLTACESAPGGLSEVITDERLDELRWRQLLYRPKSVELDAYQKTEMHEVWRFAVQSYTSCNLTKSSDKLMAIASMANRMKEVFEEGYFAGLWEHSFVEQLGWRVIDFRKPALDSAYRAPSWSWASVDGIVNLPERINFDREYTMKIPRDWIHVVLEKPETVTGTIHFASLTAETELHELVFSSPQEPHQIDRDWWWAYDDGRERQAWCQFFPDQPQRKDNLGHEIQTHQQMSEAGQRKVACTVAMLAYSKDLPHLYDETTWSYSGIALALRRVKDAGAKAYCRIGLVEFRNLGGKVWDDMQALRVSTSRKEGEVAVSDKRGKHTHVITLL